MEEDQQLPAAAARGGESEFNVDQEAGPNEGEHPNERQMEQSEALTSSVIASAASAQGIGLSNDATNTESHMEWRLAQRRRPLFVDIIEGGEVFTYQLVFEYRDEHENENGDDQDFMEEMNGEEPPRHYISLDEVLNDSSLDEVFNESELRELSEQITELLNSTRGDAPASTAAIDCLPLIAIEKSHLNDGSGICAICQEDFTVGESAKKLPCLHLYHMDCILAWLNSKNSCPLCRAELPTDDCEYEEENQNSR